MRPGSEAAPGFANHYPILLCGLLYGSYLLRLFITQDRTFMFVFSLLCALGGVFAESCLSQMDLVLFTLPDFCYVPAWLPGLYLHGAFALR